MGIAIQANRVLAPLIAVLQIHHAPVITPMPVPADAVRDMNVARTL
jgi:hypothetical protein